MLEIFLYTSNRKNLASDSLKVWLWDAPALMLDESLTPGAGCSIDPSGQSEPNFDHKKYTEG